VKKSIGEVKGIAKKINVYMTLKNAIQFLELIPGSAINEANLVEELGVSRTPIREALIRLADEMLVEIYPQKGTYVAKINLSLAKEMAYMRHIIETEVFNALCRNKADLSDITAESMFFMQQAIKKQDIVAYVRNDDEFHRSIFKYAKHEPIWNIISNTRTHYLRFLMLDMAFPNSLDESYQDHEKIVECIHNGNIEELDTVLNTHHDHDNMKREEQLRKKYSEYFA
jgi:DNA-binding GntR family transcriptional regulator